MASLSELKKIHDQYMDPTISMDTYTGKEAPFLKDTVSQLILHLSKAFSSGGVKGERLIALCFGPFFQCTLPAYEYFEEIIICGPNDKCITEIEKWRKNEPGAIDWSHAAKELCSHRGKGESWTEKQEMWKKKINKCFKYDVCNSDPLSPNVLPKADCLLLSHCLESHVTDKETFNTALKNVSTLLKSGGHLILIACLEGTFYMVGSYKFPQCFIDAPFVKQTLHDACYEIKEVHECPRTVNQLYDKTDYKSMMVVIAMKR